MRGALRAWSCALALALCTTSCNGLLGLDDRPERDADVDAASEARDTNGPDPVCNAVGMPTCASGCFLLWTPASDTYSPQCGVPKHVCGNTSPFDTDPLYCEEGQACASSYKPTPPGSTPSDCFPLCNDPSVVCPENTYCFRSVVGSALMCHYCEPSANDGAPCPAPASGSPACVVDTVSAPPRCGAAGAVTIGGACDATKTCAAGLLCDCTSGAGTDCKSGGICRRACRTNDDCGGGACSPYGVNAQYRRCL